MSFSYLLAKNFGNLNRILIGLFIKLSVQTFQAQKKKNCVLSLGKLINISAIVLSLDPWDPTYLDL